MDNNKNFQDRQDEHQEPYTSQRIRPDGLNIFSKRNPDISVYSPKTPYSERKNKLSKGFNGLSKKQKEDIELALYVFINYYSYSIINSELPNKLSTSTIPKLPNDLSHCKWIVFTFDSDTSDEALINLLKNFKDFDKSIKYRLNKIYKTHGFEPYIIVYGIRERTSYDRNIPCFDVNILCVAKDQYGNDLFNELTLIKHIYQSASKCAKETIEIPKNYFCCPPNNVLDNYKQLANYLKNQVDKNVLRYFQGSQHAALLPNTFVHIPKSLKIMLINYKFDYPNSTPEEHRKVLKKHFSKIVTLKDKQNYSYKCIAQLNNQSNEAMKNFPKLYQEKYYLEYPDRNLFNSLDTSIENSKVSKPNYTETIFSSYLRDEINSSSQYRAILKFILDEIPIEWQITSLTDLAIAINPELTKLVVKYKRVEAIKDIRIRSAIVRETVKLATSFFEIC